MNWKLVGQLSLFGLAMGLATVFVIPSNLELLCWLVIFVISAYLIATRAGGRSFLHGLATGIANGVWVTLCHVLLYDRYLATHAREAAMMASSPMATSPRLMMALVGPVIGVISGVILGVFALIATMAVPRSSSAPPQ